MAWIKMKDGRYRNSTTGKYSDTIPTGDTGGSDRSSSGYMVQLSKAVESLRPGGSTYKKLATELGKDAQLYGNKLQAGAISSGLGNAVLGNQTRVFKELTSAKTKLQSDMMSQYISSLQNLVSLASQQEESAANRELQASQLSTATPGFTAAGTQLSDFGFGSNPTSRSFGGSRKRVSSSEFPSLYGSAGYGGSSADTNNDVYSALTSSLFGGETVEPGTELDYSMLYGTGKTPSGGTVVYR